jgi:DNA repair protein RecN (Recombination protein N)
MLTALSIRDIVLIEKLDLQLESGLSVLSGETGAGKSILLDSLGLALGARGDSTLVRTGQDKGTVTAAFSLSPSHLAHAFLKEQEIDAEGEIVVKRVQMAEGASRATINDQPVSINVLRQLSAMLVELHGQHADRALVNSSAHRDLLDAFGGLETKATEVATLWKTASGAAAAMAEHREVMARAEAERDYIEHAVKELSELAPEPNEEQLLAEKRQLMMQSEQYVSALDEAEQVLDGGSALESRLNAALRRLERRKDGAGGRLDEACSALDRVLHEVSETLRTIDSAKKQFSFDPSDLEKSEERLFALRAAARKHRCTVDDLASVRQRLEGDLKALTDGGAKLAQLEQDAANKRRAFEQAADALSAARKKSAKQLDKAVMTELPALKLDKAKFETLVATDAATPGAHGIDRVEFQVSTNPGTPLQPLMKIASGGELARFMLALKVVLAAKGSAPVLIFDEIDTGVGGAVADAIGRRLARLAEGLQVIAVTHSPQVAARAAQHLLISKMEDVGSKRMVTRVQPLSVQSRKEELARMLSGATVTDAARAQADALLAGQG